MFDERLFTVFTRITVKEGPMKGLEGIDKPKVEHRDRKKRARV